MAATEPLRRQSELEAITDYAEDFITLLDLDFRHLFANRAMAQAVGLEPEAFVGKTALELGAPAAIAGQMQQHFQAVARSGQPERFEFEAPLRAGQRVLQCLVAPVKREDGSLQALICITRDITGWKRAEADLLETRERFEALTENAANIVCVTDMKGAIRFVSPAVMPMLGRRPEDMVGRNVFEWVHPEDLPLAQQNFRRLREDVGAVIQASYRYRHKDGGWRLLEVIGKSRNNRLGEYLAVVSARDVTEREQANQALRASQERLDRALEASGLGMWDWDLDSGELYLDRRTFEILGHTPDDFRPHIDSVLALTHPDDVPLRNEAISRHLRGETPHYEIDYRVRSPRGDYRWIRSRGQITQRRPDGRARRVTGTIKDIDAERRIKDSLDSALAEVKLLLEATDEGVIGLDATGTVMFANGAATRMLDLGGDELLGNSFDALVRHTSEDGVDLIGHQSLIVRCILEGQRFRGSNELFWTSDTRALPVEFSVSPVTSDGRTHGAVLVFRDVSEKRALSQQLRFQALHDPLTGLINRRGFESKLTHMLGSARSSGLEHALCYVDLDHFKVVNDTCGHAAGDELLRQLPAVLRGVVRRNDIIARLGGDEFAVLLENCPLDRAARVAESIRDAVRDFRFVWQYRTFTIGASIGVVGVTAESHGLAAVLGAADAACYVAKDQGPNHVHVSYPHDLAIIRRRGEMRWVARLKSALEENQFRLHFQSIAAIDGSGEQAQSHELLLRLVDSRGELIPPGAFLPAAERYQLMSSIDQWVVDNALRYIAEQFVPDARLRDHRFGINLSGESLRDGRVMQTIESALQRHGVPPTMLYFEVTETAAIANLGSAVDFMRRLKELGCRLALDDFGSGMSSFSYLKHLPVDYLKIDGSFVKDMLENPVDQSIVRAVHSVSRQMGIATIAEYVESTAVLEALRAMGINYAQGFAIARPRPLEEFVATHGGAARAASA